MVPLTRRMMWQEKGRFAITVGGVAFMIMLMLFLFGIYYGVARGSTGYVRSSTADVWVSMQNSTNLLRSSSFMQAAELDPLHRIEGVNEVSGLLRLIATAEIRGKPVTLFIFGYDPSSEMARPDVLAGTAHIKSGDVVLDRAFAAKHRLTIGDSLIVQKRPFRVRALSTGTNALAAQFCFVTLLDAQQLLGFPDVVSFGLLGLDSESTPERVVEDVTMQSDRLAAFSRDQFITNNIKEMETGILPVLWTIALFGAIVGTTVLAMLLYSSVQERRTDYALLSAVGAPHSFLRRLVVHQAVLSGILGFILGLFLFLLSVPLLHRVVPEIELATTSVAIGITFFAAVTTSVFGSLVALRTLRGIYPDDVFAS